MCIRDSPVEDHGYHIRSLKNWHPVVRPRELQELAENVARKTGHSEDLVDQARLTRIEEVAVSTRLSVIWLVITFIACYYSLSMWIASQHQQTPLGMLIDVRPVQGSLVAIVLVGVLTGLALRVLRRHMLMNRDENRLRRLPTFPVEPINPNDGFVKALGSAKIFMVVFPIAALVHFYDKIIGHGKLALCDDSGVVVKVGFWDFPETLIGHKYCFGQGYKDAAVDGVTFFPLVEPIVLGLLAFWILCEFFRVIRIFMK